MNVEILGTGSSGNCAVIDNFIAIDAGVNVTPECEYLLLTHSHSDHTKFLKNFKGVPTYCLSNTLAEIQKKDPYFNAQTYESLGVDTTLAIDDGRGSLYYITPIKLRHDVACVGYSVLKLTCSNVRSEILFATDFEKIIDEDGIINDLRCHRYDQILLECNNTLSPVDFTYKVFPDEPVPKDDFHRTRSYKNHANASYITSLFERAGFTNDNPCTVPTTLLHKSSSYYTQNTAALVRLASITNVQNMLL